MRIRFGDYELDTGAHELRYNGRTVPIEPQVFDVLALLVEHRDRLVTKEELLDQIWGGNFVSEAALSARVMANEFGNIDVTHRLSQLSVPTLVLHSRNELTLPFDEGRLLALQIPHARLVALDSKNHLILEHEPAWSKLLAEVRAFLQEPNIPAGKLIDDGAAIS